MTRTIALTALATAAFAAAGCGSGGNSGGSAEDQIRTVFSDATSALQKGDGAKYCALLTDQYARSATSSLQTATGRSDCAGATKAAWTAVKAVQSRDWRSYCASISKQAAEQLAAGRGGKASSCAGEAAALAATPQGKQLFDAQAKTAEAALKGLGEAKLEQIKVDGDSATARIRSGASQGSTFKFEKVDGSWKMAGMEQ